MLRDWIGRLDRQVTRFVGWWVRAPGRNPRGRWRPPRSRRVP